jgi:hypothetical protein
MKEKKLDREEFIKQNNKDRMWFVEYWAEFVRTHPDQEWSRQQNIIINSQLQGAKHYPLTAKEYLEIKGDKCTRK